MNITIHKVEYNPNTLGRSWALFASGLPKSGKTTGASTFPKPLFIDFEQGTDFVDGVNVIQVNSLRVPKRPKLDENGKQIIKNDKKVYEIVPPIERGLVWRSGPNIGKPRESYSVDEVLKFLNDGGGKDYETIILDPIDVVADWCDAETVQEMEIHAMGDAQYGSDWAKSRNKLISIVDEFIRYTRMTAKILVILCHQKQVSMVKNKEVLPPNLASGTVPVIAGRVELIGNIFMKPDSKQPLISFSGNEYKVTGSRFPALAGMTIPWNYQSLEETVSKYVNITKDA